MMFNIKINNLDNDFEKACNLAYENFSYHNIISSLNICDNTKKQIMILNLDTILSQMDAHLFISNIINQDSIIREATSYKLNEFMKNPNISKFFQTQFVLNKLLFAINDINPSVCRNIVSILPFIINQQFLFDNIIIRSKKHLLNLENLKISKKYILNKEVFALYWNLEALSYLNLTYNDMFIDFLAKIFSNEFYTIREKVAKIVCKIKSNNEKLTSIQNKLKNDENFFVRRFFDSDII